MRLRRLPAVLLPLCCNSLYAADEPTELSPIIVTATRTAEMADETLASVTVITRKEIERRQVNSVQEVLRGVPGLGVTNSGGLGKQTSVFLRGTESDHVLVLIDGIRAGSASLGTTSFQDIPIDQIERIEVVRGPRSSLYGSEAIGGVIQIFTRKGGGPLTPAFSAGGGSHSTYKVSGGLSGGGESGWFNFNASRLDTRGFNACRGQPFPPGGGCFTFEPDDDGYTNNSGSARAGYRFSNRLEAEAHFLHAQGDTEFDGTFVNESDFLQQAVGGKVRFKPTSIWEVTLQGGRTLDELESFLNGSSMTVFDTERQSASLQNDLTIAPDHLLTLGVDYYNDLLDSTGEFAETSRDDKAGFAQYQGAFGGHELVLGTRFDDNEQFGGNWTGNVTWGYTFGKPLRVTAGWGTAFKAASFNDLYFPPEFIIDVNGDRVLVFEGNPNLDPESSESWEIGASGEVVGVHWSLSGYYTELDDLIATVSDPATCPRGSLFCPRNIDEARILGLEAVASTTLFGWDIAANLSLIDPENRGAGPNEGNVLPRRAEQMFRFDLDRRFGPVRAGATVYGEGRRFNDVANAERLPGYVLVDLRAGVELYKGLFLEGKVGNLLDKEYETVDFFNQDDTNLFVTLRYQPDAL